MTGLVKTDEGSPAIFFHYTRKEIDVEKFLPFTHFGTCQAAHERWCGTGSSNPGARFFPVVLKISNPLAVKDSGDLDIFFGIRELAQAGVDRETLEWIYQPMMNGPVSRKDFHEEAITAHSYSDFQPPSRAGLLQESLKQRFLRHIGLGDPDIISPMKDAEITRELAAGNLYRTSLQPEEERSRLKDQRKIIALEALGYDGLVYENREEDYGSVSYCIFRPEQAVSAFEHDWGSAPRPEIKVDFNSYKIWWDKIYDPADYEPALRL